MYHFTKDELNGGFFVRRSHKAVLGLSNTEREVFAIIRSFTTRSAERAYYGSQSYLADICGRSKSSICRAISSLMRRGLVYKKSILIGGRAPSSGLAVNLGLEKNMIDKYLREGEAEMREAERLCEEEEKRAHTALTECALDTEIGSGASAECSDDANAGSGDGANSTYMAAHKGVSHSGAEHKSRAEESRMGAEHNPHEDASHITEAEHKSHGGVSHSGAEHKADGEASTAAAHMGVSSDVAQECSDDDTDDLFVSDPFSYRDVYPPKPDKKKSSARHQRRDKRSNRRYEDDFVGVRYMGNCDPDFVLQKALERSYGKEL